jgi:dolichyl-phosphate-mannose-protein mannosyltransferase
MTTSAQQVTLYSHMDENNDFVIEHAFPHEINTTLQYLKEGDIVRLRHTSTNKFLRVVDHRPTITNQDNHYEVSCYEKVEDSDANSDLWRLTIDSDGGDPNNKHLKAITSQFRLEHQEKGCHLFSHKVKLPDWGFGQQEVTCIKNGLRKNTL